MNTSYPMVSIVVASYNDSIDETIKSIAIQDYCNIQLIIADDASDTFDEDTIQRMTQNTNIQELVIHRNICNLGTVKNLNKIFHFVKGEYIEIMGQGDCLLHERVISEYVNLMQAEECDVLCANCCYAHTKLPVWTKQFVRRIRNMNRDRIYRELLLHCFILAPSVFAKSNLFTNSPFDEEFRLCEDWPKWLKLMREEYIFCFVDKVMISYSCSGVSLKGNIFDSSEMLRKDVRNIYNDILFPQRNCLGRYQRREQMYYYYRRVEWGKLTYRKKIALLIKYLDVFLVTIVIKHKVMKLRCR